MPDGGATWEILFRVVLGTFVFTGFVMLCAWTSWQIHDRREAKRRAEYLAEHPDRDDHSL